MIASAFVDTNVLIYAGDRSEPEKRQQALSCSVRILAPALSPRASGS
jgi:predicted nucleic acid-binding protein